MDTTTDGLDMRADGADVEEPGPSPMDTENVQPETRMGDLNPDKGQCEPGGKGRETDENPPPGDDNPKGSGAMPHASRTDNAGGLSNHVDALLSETYRLVRQHKIQLREEAHVPKIDVLGTIHEVRRRRETRKHQSRTQRREVLQAIAIRVGEPTQTWDEDYQLRLSQRKSETQDSSEGSDGEGSSGLVVLPPSRRPGSRQLRRRLQKELIGEAEKRRKLRKREEPPPVGAGGCAVGGATFTVNAPPTGAACSEEPATQVPRGGSRPPADSCSSAGNLCDVGSGTESDHAAPAASPGEGALPGLFTYGSLHAKRVGSAAHSEDQEHVRMQHGHVPPADLHTTVESTRAHSRRGPSMSAGEGARETGASSRAEDDTETERARSGANGSQWAESGRGGIGDGGVSEDETNARAHTSHIQQKRQRADLPSGPAGNRFHDKPHRPSRLPCLVDEEEEEERSYASRRKRAKALWRLRKGSQASRDDGRLAGRLDKAAVASDGLGAATGPKGTTAPGPAFGDRRPPAPSGASDVPPLERRRAVPSIRDWSSQGTSSTQTAEVGSRLSGLSDSGVACFYAAAADATAQNRPTSKPGKGRADHDDAERAVGKRVGILGLVESFAASKRSSIL